MKEFFKMFGAVLAGLFVWGCITSFFGFLVLISMIGAMNSDTEKVKMVEKNSILALDLSKPIAERTSTRYSSVYSSLSMSSIETIGLADIYKALNGAAYDGNITALYIKCSDYAVPDPATAEALRKMILEFKEKSGKPVMAFSNDFRNFDYYVASAADSVFMRKTGDFQMCGLSSEQMFYKGALDKFGISAQVIRHGKFKAAVEPFLQETMSDANREQISTYLNDFWGEVSARISESRNIPIDRINAHANSLDLFANDDLCLGEGFLDGIIFESDFKKRLAVVSGREEGDDPQFVSIKDYNLSINDKSDPDSRIAVIYADGEIDSESGEESFSSKEIVEAVADVMDDDNIKAVVLRVNSPGGSATEAEIMYNSLLGLKDRKPLVVSMGGYAASGGYYISCPADRIFAENNTVTGSIGVFGLMFSPEKLMRNTLGINIQKVSTHDHAGFMQQVSELGSDEIEIVQRSVENIYSLFVNHVAEGRGMTFDEVDAIAQGRVWTGKSALKIGLVDEIGSLSDAIAYAAKIAEVDEYRIKNFPDQKDGLEKILEDLLEVSAKVYYGDELIAKKRFVDKLTRRDGVQAYLPVSKIR